MAKPATQDNVINLTAAPPTADRRETMEERDRRRARSAIIKSAVEFCAARAAIRGGFEADHTENCVVANWDDTAGANYNAAADRALIKLPG
jgi:hypothetical protein